MIKSCFRLTEEFFLIAVIRSCFSAAFSAARVSRSVFASAAARSEEVCRFKLGFFSSVSMVGMNFFF